MTTGFRRLSITKAHVPVRSHPLRRGLQYRPTRTRHGPSSCTPPRSSGAAPRRPPPPNHRRYESRSLRLIPPCRVRWSPTVRHRVRQLPHLPRAVFTGNDGRSRTSLISSEPPRLWRWIGRHVQPHHHRDSSPPVGPWTAAERAAGDFGMLADRCFGMKPADDGCVTVEQVCVPPDVPPRRTRSTSERRASVQSPALLPRSSAPGAAAALPTPVGQKQSVLHRRA